MALGPRESGKIIAAMAKNVFIEEEGVKNLGSEVSTHEFVIFYGLAIFIHESTNSYLLLNRVHLY